MQKQKTIVITGCSSGIGLCAAKIMKDRQWRVIACVRNSRDVESLRDAGVVDVVVLDLASSESVGRAVDEIFALTGGVVDALFNNGAYGQPGAVEDLSRETLRKQFETNVFGTHELTIKLLPALRASPSGRIVQNSSILGFAAMPMRGAYNASKFALEGLSDTLRLELLGTSVKVSIIEPGPVLTRFRQNALQALKENIDIESSQYQQQYSQALERLTKEGAAVPFTVGSEAVVARLIRAVESRNPKVRYYVTFPTYLFAFLRHVLPYKWLDKVVAKAAKS